MSPGSRTIAAVSVLGREQEMGRERTVNRLYDGLYDGLCNGLCNGLCHALANALDRLDASSGSRNARQFASVRHDASLELIALLRRIDLCLGLVG